MIPAEIRAQYPQDEQGRVLFFTTPPVDTRHIVQGRSDAEKGDQLSHSLRYLAVKADREREREREQQAAAAAPRKRNPHNTDIDAETQNQNAPTSHSTKRLKPNTFTSEGEERDSDGRIRANPTKAAEIASLQAQQIEALKTRALATFIQQLNQSNDEFYKTQYGDKADEYKAIDAVKQQEWLRENNRKDSEVQNNLNVRATPDVMVEFKRNPWNGVYKDDFDARY